ncbi:hypothetical protein LGM81_26850, partial [Burkholderia multivorans]|nr:hypothetical protein [Burkholderia multivorans]
MPAARATPRGRCNRPCKKCAPERLRIVDAAWIGAGQARHLLRSRAMRPARTSVRTGCTQERRSMSEVTVSPLPDRLRDRVAPTRASPLARRQARTRIARGVRRRASARTVDAPLDREPG